MLRLLIIFSYIVLISQGVFSQDTLNIKNRLQRSLSVWNHYVRLPYDNPAIMYDKQNYSFSTFQVEGLYDNQQQALVQQLGCGENSFSVLAQSFYCLNTQTRVWGQASYLNGKDKQVKWNESSDYLLLVPYVIADSIGGDLYKERYFFEGGIATQKDQLTYGLDFSYRALLSYRDVDPRPRNIVADLKIKMGGSYAFNTAYNLGFSIDFQRYKQRGSIDYYNEMGISRTYHMLGLGEDYRRFAGTTTSTLYRGNTWGGVLSLYPKKDEKIGASLAYHSTSIEKNLPGLNQLPLVHLYLQQLASEISWKKRDQNALYACKITGNYQQKRGVEHIVSDKAHNYQLLSSSTKYRNHFLDIGLSGLYETKQEGNKHWEIAFLPEIKYLQSKETYQYVNREQKQKGFCYNTDAHFTWYKNNMLIKNLVSLGLYQNFSLSQRLTGLDLSSSLGQMIQQNFEMKTQNFWHLGYGLQMYYTLKDMVYFAKIKWNYSRYENEQDHHVLLMSIGINI